MIDANREELGRLVMDNVYLVKPAEDGDERNAVTLDSEELQEDEDVYYEMRLKDVMETTFSSQLSSKQRLLDSAYQVANQAGKAANEGARASTSSPRGSQAVPAS